MAAKDRSVPLRKRLVGACVVVLVAATGVMVSIRSARAVPTGFIQRQGAQLTLNGQPYRFTGINIYNANSDGYCGYNLASGTALSDTLDMIGSGGDVIRAWFFQSFATTNGQRDWTAFDHMLSVAAAHDMRVIPVLGNQWADCEPAAGYKDESWYEGGYTQADPGG